MEPQGPGARGPGTRSAGGRTAEEGEAEEATRFPGAVRSPLRWIRAAAGLRERRSPGRWATRPHLPTLQPQPPSRLR